MYVVTVLFEVDATHLTAFMSAMLANALDSRTLEPGCRQFDVCIDPNAPDKIFLYEVYDDPAAFDAHVASRHFQTFDARVADWVLTKRVQAYQRIAPVSSGAEARPA
ncbi:MAG: putative quinol monooxygenase [Casimicrobiaceae bacterium]